MTKREIHKQKLLASENKLEMIEAMLDMMEDYCTKKVTPKKTVPKGALMEFNDLEVLLETVPQSAQHIWLKIYDAKWIKTELLKAHAWIETNPQKRPKSNMGRFLGGWLSRSWERHRKTIPGATSRPIEELMRE